MARRVDKLVDFPRVHGGWFEHDTILAPTTSRTLRPASGSRLGGPQDRVQLARSLDRAALDRVNAAFGNLTGTSKSSRINSNLSLGGSPSR